MRKATGPILVALLLLLGTSAVAGDRRDHDTPGHFDYWLLSLSWSPQYCASASQPEAQQCGEARHYGFVVHGLWPQYERGFPRNCSTQGDLAAGLIDRLLPIMPSRSLIRHEWRAHGSCSGMSSADYFGTIEKLWKRLRLPQRYTQLSSALQLSPAELERDFIKADPHLSPASIALQCSGRYLQEVRLCMDRDLQIRDCAADVKDRCGQNLVMRPVRGS